MSLRHFKIACLNASALVTIATRSKHHYDIVAPDMEKRRQAKWRNHVRICEKFGMDPHSPEAADFVSRMTGSRLEAHELRSLSGIDYSSTEARIMSHYIGERGPLHG